MTKLEVQQRVLNGGNPLSLDLFTWDEKTNTFSSDKNELILDFKDVNNCTFNTGSYCTFTTGSYCTFNTGSYCTFKTYSYCTFNTGSDCTFTTGSYCTFNTGSKCTFNTCSYCTFKTYSYCTFNTGSDCTFNTCSYCTFKTYSYCTFNTGSDCTFKTYSYCTFNTGSKCTFNTDYNCTFTTDSNCTFNTCSDCVIVRRDIFEVIQPLKGEVIQICPYPIIGFLSNGYLNRDKSLGEYIIIDGILSKIISKKSNIYKVKLYDQTEISYVIKHDDVYSHGNTIKEAKESLIYKISNRDTSKYKDLKLDSILTKEEAIKMYRVITGACESGTRYFVEQNKLLLKDNYTIQEIIDLTRGQYGNETLKSFLIK